MPFWLITGLILLVLGLGLWLFTRGLNKHEEPERPDRGAYDDNYDYQIAVADYKSAKKQASKKSPLPIIGLAVAFFGVLSILASLVTVVPTQNIGVVTSFNKITGRTLDAGLHLKAPWHKVTD